ncbi:PDR/VanB family oxidoreductase [Pseudoduganella namucuonensis]|uniref:Vanillate O-demethylase ferredoxin subunit n=1 Tax=Pseudoduganella namucuonensis TaxID=1035707 RepID=A0A1I7L7F7_9BURK|nr:PDR/VanB family oxidoreductase [Pseudoduganella namucuonensis]SFV05630.1 vanillate O-demethylase ferredoxin subunit [Pseudoduganella namucuonensis]
MSATLQVRVRRAVSEAEDIRSFELVREDGGPLPAFGAGAHIDVHLRDGLVRQYSLCNPPRETERYVIGVLRDPASRGGSRAMHDEIQEGSVLRISEPKNHFPLTRAPRSLLLAGGIGVTPILAMAESLAADGADFDMHYATRAPERTAFRDRIAGAPYAERVRFYHDTDAAGPKLDVPALLAAEDAGTHLYVCGPGGFIAHVVESAKALGWPQERVHLEYFAGAAVETGGDAAFDVKLASSGRVIAVPAGTTVMQALADQGVHIPVSCEQGVCGTCLTRVLDGVPDHRDLYLTDEERAANDQFTPCCSRSKSGTLVLDL